MAMLLPGTCETGQLLVNDKSFDPMAVMQPLPPEPPAQRPESSTRQG